MDNSDYVFYSTFFVTIGLALAAFVRSLAVVRRGGNTSHYATRFAFSALLAGLASGTGFFYGVLWIFDALGNHINVGHGEVLIAAPFFNFCLGVVFAMLGATLLRWASH